MLNIISVGIGIVLFIYSITLFWRIFRLSKIKALAPWWLVLILLVTFFLLGYLGFEYFLLTGRELFDFKLLVSQVFLWGAVFVLISVRLFYVTTHKLSEARSNLEKEVAQRTKELQKTIGALKKSEERFKHITESAGEWIWEVTADGLYTYSNPPVENILGYKPEEIVGKKYFYDFFRPDIKEQLKEAALDSFAKKLPFTKLTNDNVHKNGRTVILETTAFPVLDQQGKLLGYRGADMDITERSQTEQQIKEKVKELEKFHDLAVGRELKMIELEKEIKKLKDKQ